MRATRKQPAWVPDKILVATDFSTTAEVALQRALEFSRTLGSRVSVLHVCAPVPAGFGPEWMTRIPGAREETVTDFLRRRAAQALAALQERMTSNAEPIECTLRNGDPASEIVSFASTNHFDLIVIGTHGEGGAGQVLHGSVADQVMRTAHCPVLTVPPQEESWDPSKRYWPPQTFLHSLRRR